MIDIHCHLLPNLDDGSPNIEESIELIKSAYNAGVTDIIVTPHYIYKSKFATSVKESKELLEEVKKRLKKEKIPVKLYLGNEVFVENDLLELLQDGMFSTLNNSRYLLFEMSRFNYYHGIYDLLFKLQNAGITPIIAHPERYTYLQKNPNEAIKLIEHGALFQMNVDSYYGAYGNKAKDLFILLIKHFCCTFLATDTHNINRNKYDDFKRIQEDLLKYLTEDEIQDLVHNNALNVIKDKEIKKLNVIPFKKTIFGKWK